MTKNECLTQFIQAKEYIDSTDCLTYGYEGYKTICKQYYSISLSNISEIKKKDNNTDALIWNMMRNHCNSCTCCDGEELEVAECKLSEDDENIKGFFVRCLPHSSKGTN